MGFDPGRRPRREDLKAHPPLCTDGAWGTELMKQGGRPGELLDLWNVSAPEKVYAVARAYVEAGSRVILTNTFSSNRAVLEARGAGGRAAELSRAGAEISRRAAAGRAWVFASVGPTGKLVSAGELDPAAAEEIFAEQAAALAEGGADGIVVETQSDLEEARAALRGCLRTGLAVGVTFTFDSGRDRDRTMMGVTVEQACRMAREEGAAFVGANCGMGIEAAVPLARRFAACGEGLPIWIKGNAGRPEAGPGGTTVYRAGPEVFAAAVAPLLEAGVRFLGGCCGSTPEHIRAMVRALALRLPEGP